MTTRSTKLLLALPIVLVMVISGCATYRQVKEIDAEIKKIDEKMDTVKEIDTEVKKIEGKLDTMLEQPAPVTKETAAAIAIRFAGLKKVTAIRQPQVNYSHTQTFNVMGNDGKGDILIGLDPATGEIIKMVKQCPYPGRDTENVMISGQEAILKAQEFLSKHRLPPIPEDFVMEEPRLKTTWRKKHWEVVWRHYVDEVQVLPDFISFLMNAETGEIVSYSKVRHLVEVPHQPKLSADDAVERAKGVLGKGSLEHYDPGMEVLKTTRKILYPNNYFEDFVWHWSARQALAWIVQFGEDEEPAMDVWIDALSGEPLGGEIYERPVPELWGIPDQTSDITSYPGWEPALDKMQYNTSHTFLGDANETDVVNSIANGEYFILQTHGSTTTTAEYARIRHSGSTDAQRLTPDEIPNNNLRYALMSHCRSAHDGTGQDFKDVFIDRGSDVFQGYVESMNPDPYEDSLLRYLAEGRSLWNAHFNAVADVSPWFTIVIDYGPPLYCYNQLRLAPLHVDVSVPSFAWHTVTITASVRNLEDARHTTATNVMAELQMPSGFIVISGANPQTAPALNWYHTWTAQWTVLAPLMTIGTRTFDVVVWSHNLGVAVDDFDNPYHKVDVNFWYPFVVVLKDYLELVKWWELGEELYQQFPEPGQILSISRDLDRYKSADDVQKDSSPFLRLMASMAELEFGFGNHFSEPGKVAPEAVRQYLELVEAKMAYLKQLQEVGLGDVKEVLTKVSAMQMRINAAALKAFWEKPNLVLMNQRGETVKEFNILDSVSVGVKKLVPHKKYFLDIVRGNSKIASSYLEANSLGNIPATVLWYDVGVEYDTKGIGRLNIEDIVGRGYRAVVREQEKPLLEIPFEVVNLTYIPRVSVTDSDGSIRSGFLKGEADVYVRGENFPPGASLRIYLVKAQRTWENNDPLEDISGSYRPLQLEADARNFQELIWPKEAIEVGSYDVVIDFSPMDGVFSRGIMPEMGDAISRASMSGFVVCESQGPGHIEQEMACQAPPHDPLTMAVYGAPNPIYRDNFSGDEQVWVTIDPYFNGHNLVGKNARIYVVPHKTAAQWDTDNSLSDVSGPSGWDQTTIQPGCANVNYVPVWLSPTTGNYDVVMDFQLLDGTYNGVYDKGTDILDMADDVGFSVPSLWVTLDQIKFNHNTSSHQSDGITIRQNNATGITAPEWTKTGTAKPAAYVRDKSITIQAKFTAHSSVTSAKIKAVGGGVLGDLGEVTVSFSGGVSGFVSFSPANKTPNQIAFSYVTWQWKYRDVNNSSSAEVEAATSKNRIYVVLASPVTPMAEPWVDGILERACWWAYGESNEANAVAELTDDAYAYTGKSYNGYGTHASYTSFDLTTFLQESWADCRDMSAYLHILCRALGISSVQMQRIQGGFYYKPILPIGWATWDADYWNFHRVGYYNNKVYDACLMLNQSAPIIPKNMDVNGNYKAGLYDSGAWSPGTPFATTTVY